MQPASWLAVRARSADRQNTRHRQVLKLRFPRLSPAALLAALNQLGHDNGVGRLDLVENRYVGMKSRGMYELLSAAPSNSSAHRAIEFITLDRGAAHLKDELMPKYAELIYNGFWFAPEREFHCVSQQIHQHLPHSAGIAAQ